MTDTKYPRVVDDDHGIITVRFNGQELRGWCYDNDGERRYKMALAREYVEGWGDGQEYGHDVGYDHGHTEGKRVSDVC
jgi:hypothetical protein